MPRSSRCFMTGAQIQLARVDGRFLLDPWPLERSPRLARPAEVTPRSSRCFMTGAQIQLMRGSRRITLCDGSTITISKYLKVASWLTQYELRTRKLPHLRA